MHSSRKVGLQLFRKLVDKTGSRLPQKFMSSSCSIDISGIYPPIATAFHADESIAYQKLQENMEKWNSIPFKGYVVQGSNGEYAYLNEEERVDVVKRVKAMIPPGKLIISGSGCESTQATISMTKRMADAGSDAVLVVTPCFYKGGMTNQALERHFTLVADASPVPVILYSVPGNTGIDLTAEVVIRLSEHPNIIGLKDSGGDISKLAHMVYKTKENNFQILAGSASFLYPAYSVGCVGGVCGLANVLGQECCDLAELSMAGEADKAKHLQHRLVAPNLGVTRKFGVPGLKVAMEWFGYYGGPVRSPLQPLGENDVKTLRNMFEANGFKTS